MKQLLHHRSVVRLVSWPPSHAATIGTLEGMRRRHRISRAHIAERRRRGEPEVWSVPTAPDHPAVCTELLHGQIVEIEGHDYRVLDNGAAVPSLRIEPVQQTITHAHEGSDARLRENSARNSA